jgi:hypothetical protein
MRAMRAVESGVEANHRREDTGCTFAIGIPMAAEYVTFAFASKTDSLALPGCGEVNVQEG